MRLTSVATPLVVLSALFPLRLCAVEDEKFPKPAVQPMRGASMFYGPILSCSVEVPGHKTASTGDAGTTQPAGKSTASAPSPKIAPSQVVPKAVAVKLGEGDEGAIAFDTDLMRMAAGWTTGFLDLKQTNVATYKGTNTGAGIVAGHMQFETLQVPGWSADDTFDDPRPERIGPLPHSAAQYRGMYLHGDRTVFAYSVRGTEILEAAEVKRADDVEVIVRSFTIAASKEALSVLLDLPLGAEERLEGVPTSGEVTIRRSDRVTMFSVAGAPAGTAFRAGASGVYLKVPAHNQTAVISLAVWSGSATARVPSLTGITSPTDLSHFCKGGPERWPALPALEGKVSDEKTGYVVDTIPLPEDNPWKSWMRISAFDFLPDGRAVVATLNGDIFLVSGLDAKLGHVQWKRIAVGLYEPLGLKIRNGEIFVHGKDQITRLKDLNGDGEADFYECFNNDRSAVANYHTFAFDLQTDRAGNFYYVIGGNQLGTYRPWHACLVKVTSDGRQSEIVATGFRAPNGLTVGPQDELIVSDNQGHWIPSSKLNLVRTGGFYGHVADPRLDAKAPAPAGYDLPMCWIPMTMDNSSAGGIWDRDNGKWGPLGGNFMHLSYGTSSLFAVLQEPVATSSAVAGAGNRVPSSQASIVKVPVKFDSGLMRARFNPVDGQLYVAGLKGWQSNGAKDGCFQRVRYTGGTVSIPTGVHAAKDTLQLEFASPLDRESATDAQSFTVEQWNYQWWSTYGSPDLSPSQPGQKKRDRLDVTSAQLSVDGRHLTLTVPGLQFAMETALKGSLRFADGTEAKLEVAGTYYDLPEATATAGQ